MHTFGLYKALRISILILIFVNNCRKKQEIRSTNNSRISKSEKKNCEQEKVASSDRIEDDKKKLNLEKNDEGVYICKARLQGFHPIYLWQDSVLSKKVILAEHKRSLHGGVAMTMSRVRSLFWVPLITVGNQKLLWM